MRNKISKTFASSVAFLGLTSSAFAQETNPRSWLDGQVDLVKDLTIQQLITGIINWFIGAAVIVSIVMIVWAGYSYMTAGGDEGKVQKATKSLTNAIIGLIISLLAMVIVNFIKNTILKAQ